MLPKRKSQQKQNKTTPFAELPSLKGRPTSHKASRSKSQGTSEAFDWQSILDDVNFIRERLNEAEQSKIDKQPSAAMESLLYHTEFLYGQPQSIESMHVLYRQVMELHKANTTLKQQVTRLEKELEDSKQRIYQVQLTNSILRQQNKRIQNQFIRRVEPSQPPLLYCTTKSGSRKESETSTIQKSQHNTTSTRFTDTPPKPNKMTQILPPYRPAEAPSTATTSKEEALGLLNEQFDHLIKHSRMSQSASMRSHLRRQLFTISEQIKRLALPGAIS